MTEWNAPDYARISSLQEAMAEEVLALLDLRREERGNGKITHGIARRVPQGMVIGVDPSAEMIVFASTQFGPAVQPKLNGRSTGRSASTRFRGRCAGLVRERGHRAAR